MNVANEKKNLRFPLPPVHRAFSAWWNTYICYYYIIYSLLTTSCRHPYPGVWWQPAPRPVYRSTDSAGTYYKTDQSYTTDSAGSVTCGNCRVGVKTTNGRRNDMHWSSIIVHAFIIYKGF